MTGRNVGGCDVLVDCHILTGVVGVVIIGVQIEGAGGLKGGHLNMVKDGGFGIKIIKIRGSKSILRVLTGGHRRC